MLFAFSIAVLGIHLLQSRNPFIENEGVADPHLHVFNGTVYAYATHDYSDNNTHFRMDDWWIWKSDDLVDWHRVSVLKPKHTPADPSEYEKCYATDAAYRNGSYFWYLSTGPKSISVMKSPTPHGPWRDPLGKPLLAKGSVDTTSRDPGVLHDTSGGGDYYLIFGVKTYYIGRLNPDMISFAEKPKPVTIHNSIGCNGPGKTGDKPFLHIYNSTYYLSWGGFYATGQSPYGPFTFRGSVISTSTIAPDFRMNDTNPDPSAWWAAEDQADRHGSFFTLHGQWYFACNDRSHSSDEAHPGVYRDPILAYVHYLSNGSIAPIVIDRHGVGEHDLDALAGIIPAENYFSIQGHARKLQHQYADTAFDVELSHTAHTTTTTSIANSITTNTTNTTITTGWVASVRYHHIHSRWLSARRHCVVLRVGRSGGGDVRLTVTVGSESKLSVVGKCEVAIHPDDEQHSNHHTSSWRMTYREISCGVIPRGMVSGGSTDMTIALDAPNGEHAAVRIDEIMVRQC